MTKLSSNDVYKNVKNEIWLEEDWARGIKFGIERLLLCFCYWIILSDESINYFFASVELSSSDDSDGLE